MNTQKLKILIPVDFSKESIEGMNTGLEIGRMTNGKVVLFNVVTELTHMMEHYYQDFKNISKAFKSGEKELMEDQEMVVKDIKETVSRLGYDDISYEIEVTSGFYKDALSDFLKDNDIDLIVMGTDGGSTLAEFFTDNLAMKSMKAAEVPVMAVKNRIPENQFNKLLLGVEQKSYKKKVVAAIKDLSEFLGMKVYLVHVKQSAFEDADESLDFLKEFAKIHQFENCHLEIIDEGEVYKQINQYAERSGIDIIASISKGNNAFFKLINGSKTEELILSSKKPVLSIVE